MAARAQARASLTLCLLALAAAEPTCSGDSPACQADQEDVGLLQVGEKSKVGADSSKSKFYYPGCTPYDSSADLCNGFNCYPGGNGAASETPAVSVVNPTQCKSKCTGYDGFATDSTGTQCWCKTGFNMDQCQKNTAYNTFVFQGTPSPTPTPSPPSPPSGGWTKYSGYNCYPGNGASNSQEHGYVSGGLSECERKCNDAGALVMDNANQNTCWCIWGVDLSKCITGSAYSVWMK